VIVKLLALAAALVCGLVLIAPAGAAARGPIDFEIAAPATRPAAAAEFAGFVSSPVRAPRPFNLVGLRWRGTAFADIELRVLRRGGRWSRWADLGAHGTGGSDPIWVGRARVLQYRLDRRLRGLRLHFVNVGERRRRAGASARVRTPFPYVTRAGWGAEACPPRTSPSYGSVSAVTVHHTVSLNDYTPVEAPAIVLAVCRYHRNSNGWDDIGYNMLVDKYGVLYEGRAGGIDNAVIGAHAQGFNSVTAGIANIGDHTSLPQTPEALNSLAEYIRWKLTVHGQPLSGSVTVTSSGGPASRYPTRARVSLQRVIGHRDTGRTACPGDALYDQLDELRTLVETGTEFPTVPTARVSASLVDARLDYGEVAPIGGTLTAPDGSPLAGELVEVQVNDRGRWRTAKRVTTDSNGVFATELRPRRRAYVRVRFAGNALLGGASSARLLLHVRPVLTLDRPLASGRPGKRVPVSGLVAPRKRVLYLVLQQQIRGSYRRVGVRAVRARAGRFATFFTPAFHARYRYFVVASSDVDTDRATSEAVPFRALR